MDYCRKTKNFLIGSLLFVTSGAAIALVANLPLRAARWLPADRQSHALAFEPRECLQQNLGDQHSRSVAIGRAAFRTPLLLGGQAARAGLSCNSCHRNGRGNPDFLFSGLSGAPGTADVTSSLMSSHRGDGIANPTPIPDLGGPEHARKISRDPDTQQLEKFIRGLIVEEFDGPEPSKMTIDGLATYVRMLSPSACRFPEEQKIQLANYLSDMRSAVQAAQFALDAKDASTARLMLSSARSALGMINERYAAAELSHDRQLLQIADLELAAIQNAIDTGSDDVSLRLATWLSKMPRWEKTLARHEALSLFNTELLVAHTIPAKTEPR
jgi:hypothetical protein